VLQLAVHVYVCMYGTLVQYVCVCLCVGVEATQCEGRCSRLWAIIQHWSTRPGRHHRCGQSLHESRYY